MADDQPSDANETFAIYIRKTDAAHLAVQSRLDLDRWRDRPPEIDPREWERAVYMTGEELGERKRTEVGARGFCIYWVGADD